MQISCHLNLSIYTYALKCNKIREIIKDFENELVMKKIFSSMKYEKKNHILHHNIPKLKCTKIGSHNQGKKKLYCIDKIASLTIE